MRRSLQTIALLLAAIAAPAALRAQPTKLASTAPAPRLAAPRTAPATATATRALRAPVLDGRADDALWSTAPVIDAFRMFDPTEDGEPRFRTEARVGYDERNIYVFVRSFDPSPDSIVARLGRRDQSGQTDRVFVFIDGYHDKRSAFAFGANAAGVQTDIAYFNDGNEDDSWNAVWDVATRIDSLGWTAEFRIPLSQIRYQKRDTQSWGLGVVRDIARYNERLSWPLVRKSKSGIVSQFGDLEGLTGLGAPRRLEVAPYTVAKTENAPSRAGDIRQRSGATAGADIKYGLTSNITLDATVNPDFGQVEADPSVLNLSAAETFYPEKRPFFLEGQGLFRFDVNCNDGACSGLFYSRRIGRAPQLSNDYADAENPAATTILGAAKLTGQLRKGTSIGILDAVTQREASFGDRTIEPRTNYFVGRLQQDFRKGQSTVGAMVTNVRRGVDRWSESQLRDDALAGGIDFNHQFLDRKYAVNGYVAQSLVRGSEDAIARTQLSSVHFYQRPDDDIEFDSTRTSLRGGSAMLSFNKQGGKRTRFNVNYQYLSPGFEINDVGYLGRANQQSLGMWFQLRGDTPRGIYRFWSVNFNQWSMYTPSGERTELGGNVNAHMQLKNMWWLHWGQNVNAAVPSYCDNCARGGPVVRQERAFYGWAGVEGDQRSRVTPGLFSRWGRGDGGRSSGFGIDPWVDVKVSSRLTASLSASYGHDVNATQWVDNYGDLGSDTTHYTFGRLDQHTMSVTTRLNFTATPTLSVQLYAQPFVTSGAYSDWIELADSRASAWDARYARYAPGTPVADNDFNFKQLRGNAVLRWEYRPGSALFVVWGQERTDWATDLGTFGPRRDYQTLFRAPPRNVFMVKGSYWLSL